MGRFRKSFTVKLDIKTKEIRHSETKFPELKIQSGIFSDTRHYAKNITAQGLYSILLYGTKDGRIPGRNVLDFANKYIEDNKERFVEVYLKNKDDIQNAGQIIGTDINNKHKMLVYGFTSPSNAPSTIKRKGRNDPLVDTGMLVKSLAFSINGKGRHGKG